MEGSLPYSGGDQTGLELPVWEYGRDEGIAIVGGYVYYGSTLPELYSKYIYGDFGSGKIWALQYDGVSSPINTLLVDTDLRISSFGVNGQNELYICSLDGQIYSLRTSASPSPSPIQSPSSTSTPTPIPTPSATPTPTLSQSPSISVTPQETLTPQPQPPENNTLSYVIILLVALAIVGATAFILKKRQQK